MSLKQTLALGLLNRSKNLIDVRVTDGISTSVFTFYIVDVGYKDYRSYVIKRPDLEGRDGNGSIIHLYKGIIGFDFICVVGKITNREKMVAVSKLWAEKYFRYVKTGKKYDE